MLAVQHAAYAIEAELIGYPQLPPLHETLEALQATPEELWLCEEGGALCGVVGLEHHPDELVIARLFVAPRVLPAGRRLGARRRRRWRAPPAGACASAPARATCPRWPSTSASASAAWTRASRRRARGYVELIRDP